MFIRRLKMSPARADDLDDLTPNVFGPLNASDRHFHHGEVGGQTLAKRASQYAGLLPSLGDHWTSAVGPFATSARAPCCDP